jgi:HAE1 family hydrophobic/amphiphilic exporter-1
LRHLHRHQPPEEVAEIGAADVISAILAATLSFLALFVPFLLVPGLTSLLFRELILVIASIICVSLPAAMTRVARQTLP